MAKKKKKELRWIKGDEFNKWVTCLNCDHQYFIESFELNPSCPICGSRSYEETDDYMQLDKEDWWGW